MFIQLSIRNNSTFNKLYSLYCTMMEWEMDGRWNDLGREVLHCITAFVIVIFEHFH